MADQAVLGLHPEKHRPDYSHADFLEKFASSLWPELLNLCRGHVGNAINLLDYAESHDDYPLYLQDERAFGSDLRRAHDVAWKLNRLLRKASRKGSVLAYAYVDQADEDTLVSAKLLAVLQINLRESLLTGPNHQLSHLRFEFATTRGVSKPGPSLGQKICLDQEDRNDPEKVLMFDYLIQIPEINAYSHENLEAMIEKYFKGLGRRLTYDKFLKLRRKYFKKESGPIRKKNRE